MPKQYTFPTLFDDVLKLNISRVGQQKNIKHILFNENKAHPLF